MVFASYRKPTDKFCIIFLQNTVKFNLLITNFFET